MVIRSLYELIKEGFVPQAVQSGQAMMKCPDDVDLSEKGKELMRRGGVQDSLDEENKFVFIDIAPITEEMLQQADQFLVRLVRKEATPEHVACFHMLRQMLVEYVEEQEGTTPVPVEDLGVQLRINDAVDSSVERAAQATEFSVIFDGDPASSVLVVDDAPLELLHYIHLQARAEDETLELNMTFHNAPDRPHPYRTIRRGVVLDGGEVRDGNLWFKGRFTEGHTLLGYIPAPGEPEDEAE